jgi:hypothetical protein
MLTVRTCWPVVAVSALAMLLAAPVGTAPRKQEGPAPRPCPTRLTAAGGTWALAVTQRFPCAAAGGIVRKLAVKSAPPPVGRYPGRYAALVCVGRPMGARPSLIICGDVSRGRGFTATRT